MIDQIQTPLLLLVDDDWMNREIVEAQLELAGYRVLSANGGEQALELAIRHHPDLVLLDIRMYDMDGYTVCAALKQQAATTHIPVILVTAHLSNEDQGRAAAVGAAGVLLKPFDTLTLSRQIKTLLNS
ncbi:MAG: response regulator [Anaerolineaceae bacterium]|nr:response regulator [Anaerolineaceae bacterium]